MRFAVLFLLLVLTSACVGVATPSFYGPNCDVTRSGVEHRWSMTVRDWDPRRGRAQVWIDTSGVIGEPTDLEVELFVRVSQAPAEPDLFHARLDVSSTHPQYAGQFNFVPGNLDCRLVVHRGDPRSDSLRVEITGQRDEALEHGVWWIRP